jgi:hypothetical protein
MNQFIIRILKMFGFNKPKLRRAELHLVPFVEADKLLRENSGWRIAVREEDKNFIFGMVYLERMELPTQ